MKTNWHVLAARLSAQNPAWSWSRVCSVVAQRRHKPKKPEPQRKYWYADKD